MAIIISYVNERQCVSCKGIIKLTEVFGISSIVEEFIEQKENRHLCIACFMKPKKTRKNENYKR